MFAHRGMTWGAIICRNIYLREFVIFLFLFVVIRQEHFIFSRLHQTKDIDALKRVSSVFSTLFNISIGALIFELYTFRSPTNYVPSQFYLFWKPIDNIKIRYFRLYSPSDTNTKIEAGNVLGAEHV